MPKAKFTLSLDIDVTKNIKKLAVDRDITTSKLVEDLLIAELKKEDEKKNKQNFSKSN